jgi:cob(I)alamin adenosyltransferase
MSPKIYTKTGDDGLTGLLGPGRVPKNDPRIDAYGVVDELNAQLGLARLHLQTSGADLDALILSLQHDLFQLGAALADPNPDGPFHHRITMDHVVRLEREIDRLDGELTPLTQFILPGGSAGAAHLHVARTTCRRAERAVVGLLRQHGQAVAPASLIYLNRLSDLLFTLARAANHRLGLPDVPWEG